MESLVGKLIKVNDNIVFLEDIHIGAYGVVVKMVDKEEKFKCLKKHPEIMKHLIRDGQETFYGHDIMFDIVTASGEKLRLFYNEFTIVE